MDPVLLLPGPERSLAATREFGGGDPTKYDGRHRERLASMYRILLVVLGGIGLLTFIGGGMLATRSDKLRRRHIPGEIPRGELFSHVSADEYEAKWRQRFPEEDENLQDEQPMDIGMPGKGGADPGANDEPDIIEEPVNDGASALVSPVALSPLPPPPSVAATREADPVFLDAMPDPAPTWQAEPAASCGGYFGNGYDVPVTLAGPAAPQAGAEGGPLPDGALWCRTNSVTRATYCRGSGIVLDPARITLSRGGEALDSVMGRREDDELPVFAAGALTVVGGALEVLGRTAAEARMFARVSLHPEMKVTEDLLRVDPYKYRMLENAEVASDAPPNANATPLWCASLLPASERVVFVTRVEYANLFHTSTDWYNVWQVARTLGLSPTVDYADAALRGLTAESTLAEATSPRSRTPRLPIHVVFLDGHNASPMDDGWRALVLSINYIKHFTGGPACFSDAVFAPYGYHAPISQGIIPRAHDCRNEPHVRQFGYDFVRALGLSPRRSAACGESPTPVLFVRRVNYKAHPRHDGQIVRRLDNEDAIFAALEARSAAGDIRLLNGLFSAMSLLEQVQMAQEACVMVGAHGAGLSHILFAPDGEHVLELQTPSYTRPHFIAYTYWANSDHDAWHLLSSTPDVATVVARVLATAAKAAGTDVAAPGPQPAAA